MSVAVFLTLTLNLTGWLITCYLVKIRVFFILWYFKEITFIFNCLSRHANEYLGHILSKNSQGVCFFFQTSCVYTKQHNFKGLRKRTKHKKYSEIQAHNQCSNQWADLIQHEKSLQNKSVVCRKHYLVMVLQDMIPVPLREAVGR